MKKHQYELSVEWTGNQGNGTLNYKSYNRDHSISAEGKYTEIMASAEPAFLGDKTKYNPEDLFLSSIAACHMLWYLHLCSKHKIVVIAYLDNATGVMEEAANGSGKFTKVCLNPKVKVAEQSMITKATELHKEAGKMCFIANSCNFDIEHNPTTTTD
ncbi:peroxiredoxin [Salegentibacter salinarum]|uniref:Peroxiredoxin n=1 Tax=Salegentibacter salinarum TaxID=447422 RepID=A0A2N0TZ47_9FLAO|nr:OsmC family protein [Salegentibacter salinarum]PKD20015.1 peroxiredoxin [Salegentibacter salinarum]SKB97489.1 Organic hydroperoxide reductase OsmC/OhrA [Salegentibacter salinarum]